jgi:hypothetical protein
MDLQKYFPLCLHGNIIITSRNFESHVHGQGPNSHASVDSMLAADAGNLLLKSAHLDDNSSDVIKDTSKTLVKVN